MQTTMTQASSQVGLNGTRLTRFLSDLAVADAAFAHQNFAEHLGRLLDFGGSMRLSEFHDELHKLPYEPSPTSSDGLKEEILRVRMALVQTVAESFVPGAGLTRLKLPTLKGGFPLDQLATFEPYHRFYAAHQREFESKIQSLQIRVRDGVSGVSAEMAQLAALDETVRELLSAHTRKHLALIPQLLEKRFNGLLQEHQALQGEPGKEADGERTEADIVQTWTQPTGWLGRFFRDIQGLLLAELELRLLPVLGLVEAVDEEVERR